MAPVLYLENDAISDSMESFTRRKSRLGIDIVLNGQVKGLVPSYTTFDKIEGEVRIKAHKDSPFDHIQIHFEGTSKVTIQRQSPVAHVANDVKAYHPFLKLRQPISETAYPEEREFKSQQECIFPFTFVIPEHLLLHACNHHTTNPHLKAAHTQVPPTLGDAMLSSDKKTMINDMTPIASEISYKIRVSVLRRNPPTGTRPFQTISSVAKKVRIVPATIEQPPLEVAGDRTEGYRTYREKHVRKTLLGGKKGRLLISAAQPRPLQLPAPGSSNSSVPVGSHVKLRLRFDPKNDDEQPPRLRSTSSRLKVLTYYAVRPWTSFPSKEIVQIFNASTHGLYTDSVGMSSLDVTSTQWEKHDGNSTEADESRPGSSSSNSSSSGEGMARRPSVSSLPSGKSYYTTSIVVPISLPTNKTFVPTFHSCLVSRVYTLELSLSYQQRGSLLMSPSASLNIPVQITSAPGNGTAPAEDSSSLLPTAVQENQIEEEYYRPRSIAPPSEGDYLDHSPSLGGTSPTESIIQDDDDSSPPEYSSVTQPNVRTSETLPAGLRMGALR